MGHFFLKNWYLYGSTFKFGGGTSLPKPNLSTPRGRYRPVKGLSNHTVSMYFPDAYTNPIRLFQSRFVHHADLLGDLDCDS